MAAGTTGELLGNRKCVFCALLIRISIAIVGIPIVEAVVTNEVEVHAGGERENYDECFPHLRVHLWEMDFSLGAFVAGNE